jgi:hypothetical protein
LLLCQGKPLINVDSGIVAFINHGCNGTFNVGIESEWHELNIDEDGEIPEDYPFYGVAPYNPHIDRNLRRDQSVSQNSKPVKAGEELLENYLSFGGEEKFMDDMIELRKECSGGLGFIEEYQGGTIRERNNVQLSNLSDTSQ